MTTPTLRIATRRSRLALWQAEDVARRLRALEEGLRVELRPLSTSGDQLAERPLAAAGGKGLFVKELEQALVDGAADLAVHSLKDVPVALPPGLHLPAVLAAGEPRDALVSPHGRRLAELPDGARVGTSSLRRQCQLRLARPDLAVVPLRGNVETRLAKLDRGEVDAAVLAAAGLQRLGLGGRIAGYLEPDECLPAIGQGVIAMECRQGDRRVEGWLARLNDETTLVRVRAERALNAGLGGSCQVPIGGFARLQAGRLYLDALVGRPDGGAVVRGRMDGPPGEAEALGRALADDLLARGAGAILRALNVS